MSSSDSTILQRVRDVRANWTQRERRRRALNGRQRILEFLREIIGSPFASDTCQLQPVVNVQRMPHARYDRLLRGQR